MAEQIFSNPLIKLVFKHLEVVEEAIQAFREDWLKLFKGISDELKKNKIKVSRESVRPQVLEPCQNTLWIQTKKDEGEWAYIALDAETLRKMHVEIGLWKEGRFEKVKDISIENKAPENIVKEVMNEVNNLIRIN
jgi:hypothetical protein